MTERVVFQVREQFPETLERLCELARIPSVSFPGFPASEVERSAEATARLMKQSGLKNVEILKVGKAHPYVYGEWCENPGAPTLLLYAHHDVQPPGREELWNTRPFEPEVKRGPGGDRLYGRGTADDKAGILVHLAAIRAWLSMDQKLPVNVKMVVEGEEETGSESLPLFLKEFRNRLNADAMVLTDTTNFDCGVPALTIALRGLVAMEVEVRALTKSVHSGMWGGPVPDPVMGLSKMLAGLVDEKGEIAIEGIRRQIRPLSIQEEEFMREIPYDEKDFRAQVGLVSSARILQKGPNPNTQIWRFPSLTVTAIQASSRAQPSNIINDVAWAKVTVRTPLL
jgi:acetylornithine deacetylase/succinyl-diaminopimelate desuccinylase-like protein